MRFLLTDSYGRLAFNPVICAINQEHFDLGYKVVLVALVLLCVYGLLYPTQVNGTDLLKEDSQSN